MTDLIVIGAGLSGLELARGALSRGAEIVVLEARARIGGRVLSHCTPGGAYDLGPAWVWPTLQPRVALAVETAGLVLTEQLEAGRFIYQDHAGCTRSLPHGFSQDPPSMRITGGITALVEAVAAGLSRRVVRLEHAVRRIKLTETGVEVTALSPTGPVSFQTLRVALAVPPRLIGAIEIVPALPAYVQTRLAAIPGWMAGQAKALALYDRPVWRDAGLSGSAFSEIGPLGELHDASLSGVAEGALFGFFSWPPAVRAARRKELHQLVAHQLGKLFGADAGRPRKVIIQDWAREPYTATDADQTNGNVHPDYRPITLPPPWDERIVLAGAEMAPAFGGYLEGALAAADVAFLA